MSGGGKMAKVMHEWGTGKLHSGSKHGPKVTSQKQALAIGFSEARKAGEHVPARKGSSVIHKMLKKRGK